MNVFCLYGRGSKAFMTVKELIELNQMITDVEITVRKDGSRLLDQINIGVSQGIKPPFPTMVPKDERYINQDHYSQYMREAYYINKSINAWDDGKDYWQIKVNRIPSKWLDLEVYSWEVWAACHINGTRRYRNNSFHGQRINIIALPSGNSLKVKEPKIAEDESDGQMTLDEWLGEQE